MIRPILCEKLKQEAEGLETPPFPGAMGQRIYEHISAKAWDMWLSHQTILINEYRLSLMEPQTKKFLKEEMEKFLFGTGSEKPAGFVKPENE